MCSGEWGMGSCTAQSPHKRMRGGDERAHRHSRTSTGIAERGESRNPHRQQDRSARRAHAQALVRSGVAVARAPTHEATSGLAARGRNRRSVRPRAQAHGRGPGPAGTPRAGTKQQRLALSLNRGDTGGIYQNACLFHGALPAPVVLSALGGSCRVRRSFTVHDDWSSQVCFHQAMAITRFVFRP